MESLSKNLQNQNSKGKMKPYLLVINKILEL